MANNQAVAAAELHRDALICDLTLPWTNYDCADLRENTFLSMPSSSVDFVPIMLASDAESLIDGLCKTARERRYFAAHP